MSVYSQRLVGFGTNTHIAAGSAVNTTAVAAPGAGSRFRIFSCGVKYADSGITASPPLISDPAFVLADLRDAVVATILLRMQVNNREPFALYNWSDVGIVWPVNTPIIFLTLSTSALAVVAAEFIYTVENV